jgi:adenylate cyclase
MIRLSIRRKIMGIAVVLIVLMTITAILSMVWVIEVGYRLQELTNSYIPAYGDLARTNIRSLERALALRRMVIERILSPSSGDKLAAIRNVIDAKGAEVEREAQAARALINGLIEKGATFGDATALARLESRIDSAMADTRRELNAEIERLLATLDTGDAKAIADSLQRVDALRDDLNQKLDSIRADILAIVNADTAITVHKQRQAMIIAAILTSLAAALGLLFAALVSSGMVRPVRRLLEGAHAVEAGRLDETLTVTSQDEIGHLTAAFNRMVEQLRHKERMRETFGKYVDPRIVEGLIDRPNACRRRAASRHDRAVLRRQGIYRRQRGNDAAGARQGHEPVLFGDVRTDPRSWRSDRQIYRRCHHGLLGTAIHRECGSGSPRQPGRT